MKKSFLHKVRAKAASFAGTASVETAIRESSIETADTATRGIIDLIEFNRTEKPEDKDGKVLASTTAAAAAKNCMDLNVYKLHANYRDLFTASWSDEWIFCT